MELKIEREIDQVKLEVVNERQYDNIFMRKYKLKNRDFEYNFPICRGCGNRLSPNDLLKLFPEKEVEIREVANFI